MNTLLVPVATEADPLARRRALTGILEHAVASLELTDKQRESVESTYKEVGAHLAKALKYGQPQGDIFPQGSYRLGTVIRPWRDITDVFDLDVVFRLIVPAAGQDAKKYREAVGEHLREKYNGVVKPLPKGWRLDYSKERDYYLDIIPAMDAVQRSAGVIAITDASQWRDSNPRGFGDWFADISKLLPRFGLIAIANSAEFESRHASIEPLPEHTDFKSPLQRITQISKRFRDYHFNKKLNTPKHAPASIVLTTLLAKSYQRCVGARTYESGYDLLVECVKGMPDFLRVTLDLHKRAAFTLENPSLPTENLVAKWNDDPSLAKAFYDWHGQYIALLTLLPEDKAPQRKLLEDTLGKDPVKVAYQRQIESMNAARNAAALKVVPKFGLTASAAAGVVVPNLTIHGNK